VSYLHGIYFILADDFRNKKHLASNMFKVSFRTKRTMLRSWISLQSLLIFVFSPKTTSRRISIATIPRNVGGQAHFDMVSSSFLLLRCF